MRKIVCPKCSDRLTFETLCQYGIQRKVRPDGTLCKQMRKIDYGSMEHVYLFCETCKWIADEEEFFTVRNKVKFWEGTEDE